MIKRKLAFLTTGQTKIAVLIAKVNPFLLGMRTNDFRLYGTPFLRMCSSPSSILFYPFRITLIFLVYGIALVSCLTTTKTFISFPAFTFAFAASLFATFKIVQVPLLKIFLAAFLKQGIVKSILVVSIQTRFTPILQAVFESFMFVKFTNGLRLLTAGAGLAWYTVVHRNLSIGFGQAPGCFSSAGASP